MKVYLAILLFFIAALMFVQLNSNICFGCQNNGTQINSNSPNSNPVRGFAQISQISQRFLGTNNANRSLESSYEAPSLLNRNTSGSNNNLRNLGSQAQETTGFSRSITPNFSNFADRLPLRNLGRNNTNLDTNSQYQQSANQQQSLRSLPGLNNQNMTVYNDISTNSSQLRSLGRGQTQEFASRDLVQTPQLRQLPSTVANTVAGEQVVARANPTPSQGSKTDVNSSPRPQVTSTPKLENTTAQTTTRIETAQEIEIVSSQTTNQANTPETNEETTRQSSKPEIVPLMVPTPTTEEKTEDATILVLAPPLKSRADTTSSEETSEDIVEETQETETPTADTEETSDNDETSEDKAEDKTSENNAVLAPPLASPTTEEPQEESNTEESETQETETTDSENTTQEESTESPAETSSTTEESTTADEEEDKQNKSNIIKVPLTVPNTDSPASEQGITPTEDDETQEAETEETEEAKPEEEVEEKTEATEDIAKKIDLKDIEVDSELDFWNAYFAKNAKSYDDLVAESKKEDTPLLIVDALQGESGNACNLDNPCSLITALAKASSGGTILIREGDYELRQNINITQSGTEASPLVIRNYPEETVVLSGKRLSGKSADTGLINISNQKHIRIQGLEFTDYNSSKNFGAIAAIMLRRSASNIEIIQNHIHDIETLSPKNNTSALGIAIYGTSPDKPMKDLLVQGNHIHDLTLGFSESLSLSGNVDGFRIEGNHIHDVDNIGIVVAGSYGTACWESANRDKCDDSFDYARNGVIMGNTVYNVDTRKNSAYPDSSVNAAAGIYVDGARTIVVERNRVYSNGSGFSISSENAGGLAKDIIVRNNLIYNNYRTGMNLGAENADKGRVDNLTVTNNTFYNNDLTPKWGGEIFMEYDVDNSLITNNIFYADNFIYDAANDTNLDINLIINDGLPTNVSGSEDNQLLRNIYHGKGENRTWQWQGQWFNHQSFEAFLKASGDKVDEEEGSFDADPGFAFLPESPDEQVGKIRLEPSLINPPTRNSAFPLSASIVGDLDKAANPRLQDDALDIGAYEH